MQLITMNEIIKRIKAWEAGQASGPVTIQLNPTDRCNLKCMFCWQRDESRVNYENEMTEDRYLTLINDAHSLGVKKITITGGGEPFCRTVTCLKTMMKIKAHEIEGSLITNGTMFTEKNVKDIIHMGWDEVIISLDSSKREMHDYLRQSIGAYNKTIHAIKLFNQYKKIYDTTLPKICIHYVLCNKNYQDIPELIELAHDTGIQNIFLEPIVSVTVTTNIVESLKLNKQQQDELPGYIKKALKLCNKYHIENNLESLQPHLIGKVNKMRDVIMKPGNPSKNSPELFSAPCYEPWYNMIIRPNGRVGPCCMFDFSGEYCHNKSLSEIWYGDYFTKVRASLLRKELPSYCSNCNPSQIVNNERIRKTLLESSDGEECFIENT